MKSERQRQKARLDKLYSEFIRKRAMVVAGGCERCGAPKTSYLELQCAHIFSRRKLTTRWHIANAVGLCGGCHLYLDSHPEEKIQFAKKILGDEGYERLYIHSHMTSKTSPVDMSLIEIHLRQLIAELECGTHPFTRTHTSKFIRATH